jgi:hypothetical protein
MSRKRTSNRRRQAAWNEVRETGVVVEEHSRKVCEKCDKVIFHSKQDARWAFTGQFKSKSIRIYPCPAHNGMHVTKDWKNKRNQG